MKRDQFTFYRSYYEALKNLPKRDQTAVLMAVIGYALDETEPSLSGVPLSVFTLIRPTLDSGRNKARNRMNKCGTRSDQTENKLKTNQEQTCKEGEKEVESEREVEVEREKESENDSYTPPTPSPRGKRFSPPTVDEVRAYCQERNNGVDPESCVVAGRSVPHEGLETGYNHLGKAQEAGRNGKAYRPNHERRDVQVHPGNVSA